MARCLLLRMRGRRDREDGTLQTQHGSHTGSPRRAAYRGHLDPVPDPLHVAIPREEIVLEMVSRGEEVTLDRVCTAVAVALDATQTAIESARD
jgi:hypothetical protein